MNELVSVIVPVYNCEKYIETCLKSIVSQSYKQIEVLVVNDGSTDNSQNIIDSIAQNDSRVCKLWQPNSGVANARNYALENAKGDYYLFVDGDDYIGIDYVKDLLECAKANRSELVICGYTLVYTDRVSVITPGKYINNHKEEWAYRISSVWSRLFSKEFWKKNKLHFIQEKDARAEDVPVALYSNAMAANICMLNKADYYYLQHEDSAMHKKAKVKFLFPYKAFGEMYHEIGNLNLVNSRDFFDIGVLKFLAQFEYILYRKADRREKDRFHAFISEILSEDFQRIQEEWRKHKNTIDFPLTHKMAVSLFVRKIKKYI